MSTPPCLSHQRVRTEPFAAPEQLLHGYIGEAVGERLFLARLPDGERQNRTGISDFSDLDFMLYLIRPALGLQLR